MPTHTVSIDFSDRETAERAFDRLEHMDWVMVEGGTLSLSSGAPPQTGSGVAPRRHLTQDEARIMDKALLASSTLIHAGELAGSGDAGRCGERPYCLNLKDRDDFIVRKGLWAEFVGSLRRRCGGTGARRRLGAG